jgi:hypothetical protein
MYQKEYHIFDRELCRSLHPERAASRSALGQKRTLVTPKGMSALPPKADII